jgi:hypothetical protein
MPGRELNTTAGKLRKLPGSLLLTLQAHLRNMMLPLPPSSLEWFSALWPLSVMKSCTFQANL